MSAFFEWMKLTSMDEINSEIWYIFYSISVFSTSLIVTTLICAKKKPPPPPPQSLKKNNNSSSRPSSAVFSAPLSQPQLLNPPIQQTIGGGAKSAGTQQATAGSIDKLPGSDGTGGTKPKEQQSNNDNKQSGDINVDKKSTDKKPDTEKKESEKPDDEKKATTKDTGTKDTGTKDATAESKVPPTTSPNPPPQQQQPQQQLPKGIEMHKSMKVRNKKKTTPSPAPSPGNAADKMKGGGICDPKTKGTLKPNDGGDDDEEDDDETLRGVTSLKVDPKVPFTVDET